VLYGENVKLRWHAIRKVSISMAHMLRRSAMFGRRVFATESLGRRAHVRGKREKK